MKRYSLLMLIGLYCLSLVGQNQAPLYVELQSANPSFYVKMEKDLTLYQLSQHYNIPVQTLLSYNKKKSAADVKLDEMLRLPLNAKQIKREVSLPPALSSKAVPVYYEIKKGETLYSVSKHTFNEDIKAIKLRSKIKTNALSTGQKLTYAWYIPISQQTGASKPVAQVTTSKNTATAKTVANTTIVTKVTNDKNKSLTKVAPKTMDDVMTMPVVDAAPKQLKSRGIALWNKAAKNRENKFVLHKTAKLNSEIELYNPMLKRTIIAKVVGRIPKNVYESDVELIVSAGVATDLGALDSRFMVEMKYVQ